MFRSLTCYTLAFGVLASAPGAASAAQTVSFSQTTLPVGTIADTEILLAIDLDFSVEKPGQLVERHRFAVHIDEGLRDEVLGVADGLPTRERRTYLDGKSEATIDGKSHTTDLAHPVKTILRERRDGKLILTDDKGAPLPPEVAPDEAKQAMWFGARNPVDELICGKTLAIGKPIALSPAAGNALFGDRATFHQGNITPVEVHDALVVFRADVDVELPGFGGMNLAIHYGGTLTFSKTYCQMVTLAFHGTVKVVTESASEASGMKASGMGTSEFSATEKVTLPR